MRFVRRSRHQPPGNFNPPAAILVPCKGLDADFDRNVSCFLKQDYPQYQLIFVVASENDPAYAALKEKLKQDSPVEQSKQLKTALVVAGHSDLRGEKVNNLIQGLAAVDSDIEVHVFADIDARPANDWLRSLVAPLADSSVTVSTGYRWYLPGASFASQLRAAWDTSIATMLGEHGHNFAWGGSMAVRAADFKRLRVAERYWARTVSDDYGLTRAVREHKGKVRFEPRCLLASREDSTLQEFLSWANRQIIITRVYARHLWWLGLASNGLYCCTLIWGAALLGLPVSSMQVRVGTLAALATVVLLGILKARIRTLVARETFPEDRQTLSRYGSRYWQLAPLVPWVMLLNFLVAGFTRRIEWRGTHYELRSINDVRVHRQDKA